MLFYFDTSAQHHIALLISRTWSLVMLKGLVLSGIVWFLLSGTIPLPSMSPQLVFLRRLGGERPDCRVLSVKLYLLGDCFNVASRCR